MKHIMTLVPNEVSEICTSVCIQVIVHGTPHQLLCTVGNGASTVFCTFGVSSTTLYNLVQASDKIVILRCILYICKCTYIQYVRTYFIQPSTTLYKLAQVNDKIVILHCILYICKCT